MKKTFAIFFIFVFALIFVNKVDAQPFNVGFFTGYGMSSFENQDEAAGYLPVGFQALYSLDKMKWGSLNFGLEFNYAVAPFTFEVSNQQGKLWDQKVNQMVIAALVKVKFLKETFRPYARVGAGLYTGNIKNEFTDLARQLAQQQNVQLNEEVKLGSGFGFNIGAGTDFVFDKKGASAVFFEFVFHISSRTPDGANSSTGLNNWAVQLGYQLGFGK